MRRTVVVGPRGGGGGKVAHGPGYATKVLMPALQAAGLDLKVVEGVVLRMRKFGANWR